MPLILIVEDNHANMKLASLLLERVGHTVLTAVDAETGLTLARAERPDLILIDVQLPGMDGLAATALLKHDPTTSAIPVIALTAMAMKVDREKARLAGCDAYITKPLRYKELYEAIDSLLAPGDAEVATHALPVKPASPVSAASEAARAPVGDDKPHVGLRVLVAEDNQTNQKLISRQLGLLGFAADVVGTGREALHLWRVGHYALLLTDLHMPEMDGYELTAAIRALEDPARRLPIVALTADPLREEADRCRRIGMDDCLSKPLQLADLKALLAELLPTPDRGRWPAVDVKILESLVGDDDPVIILELLGNFRVSATAIAQELAAACANGEPARAGEQAHKLRSSAHLVGALTLGELCEAMETAGRAHSSDALAALLPSFERELDRVNVFLDSLQPGHSVP